MTEDEIESLLIEVDVDCDGVIQYDEFCGLAVSMKTETDSYYYLICRFNT